MERKDYLVKDSEKKDYFVLGVMFLIVVVGLGYFLFFTGINYFEENVIGEAFYTYDNCLNVSEEDTDILKIEQNIVLCRNTYTLNKGITMISSVTLDCNRSIIEGNNSFDGLIIGISGATVKNCYFRSFNNDIYLENPIEDISFNRFESVVNNQSADINLSKNYWGTLDEDEIEGFIYDGKNDDSLGNVSYKPFLCRNPITECVEEECLKCNPIISSSFTQISLGKNEHPTIDLSNYVSDLDSPAGSLNYSFSSEDDVTIIVAGSDATIIPDTDWEGDDSVTLTVTDADDLSDEKTITIRVGNINHAPVIDYVDPDEDQVLEIGEAVSFTYNASDEDGDTLTASWELDSNNATTGTSYSFTATSSNVGSHTLELTMSDGNLTDTYTWDIEVIEEGGIVGNRFPTLDSNVPDQTWDMNNLHIGPDLDDHFSEPDNGSIHYSIEYIDNTDENVEVKINFTNNKPYFYPKANWSGTGKVIFIADDGNLIKKSNNVTLTVRGEAGCNENWECSAWMPNACPDNRTQIRTCDDKNNCGTEADKPAIVKICEITLASRNTDDNEEGSDQTKISLEMFSPSSKGSKVVIMFIMTIVFVGLFGMFIVESTKTVKKARKEKIQKSVDPTSMMRLIQYLRREISQGYTEDELKKILKNEGWNEIILEGAFAKLKEIMNAQIGGVHRRYYDQENIRQVVKQFER